MFLTILFFGILGNAQVTCPTITFPVNGDVDVAVDTRVSWEAVTGIDGYSVSLGTSAGASNLFNSRSAALVNSLKPIVGLPDNTEIFVTISLFLDDGTFITCPSESFTTVDVTAVPNCTGLTNPLPNSADVGLGENLIWEYAPTATGYLLAIGTSENVDDILSEIDVGNVLTYNPPANLPINTDIYVRITPYNENGDAGFCRVEQFTTGDSSIDCTAFSPEINIPETIGICEGESDVTIVSEDRADGFRWVKINDDTTEQIVSETNVFNTREIGLYRYEAYINVAIFGETTECISIAEFQVVRSNVAKVDTVEVVVNASGIDLTIIVIGNGDYEYALGDETGTYQDSNVFSNVEEGDHQIFIRDKNGCGAITYDFIQTLSSDDFPKFFTPNNDGINDYWQLSPINDNVPSLKALFIFDRYGKLLTQINPESVGWDGTYKGKPMPSSTYWFKAVSVYDKAIQGYFALKR
ncbi:T9SS type B sorting domain-containing protein [Maribacter chungangensis]|uniref:T9SS type B sorting domain-containing protein n=1 Tax=Maribacter chungangensis TaxID=1069117 RepID=A0ABW3B702_9FLAO